jgi:hypothetical protein
MELLKELLPLFGLLIPTPGYLGSTVNDGLAPATADFSVSGTLA